jgi:hypothetical protein
VVLTERIERKEELRLLAAIADVKNYEPPSVPELIREAAYQQSPEARRAVAAESGDVEEVG